MTGPGVGAAEECGDRAPWTSDRVRDHARDNVHNVRIIVHAIDLIQCTVF